MSKIKLNNRQVKDCIISVKNSDLSDTKKNTIITIMHQFMYDKEDGVFTDGLVKQLLFDIAMEIHYKQQNLTDEQLVDKLMNIIHNMDRRRYYASEEYKINSSDFGEKTSSESE